MKPHQTVEDALQELGKLEEESRLESKSIITEEYKRLRKVVLDWAYSCEMSDTSINYFMELGREKARKRQNKGTRKWSTIFEYFL